MSPILENPAVQNAVAIAGVLVHFNVGSPTGTIRELTIACQFGKPKLERHKPEERVGRCTCGVCCHSDGRWWEQWQIGPAEDDLDARPLPSRWRRCPHCGDLLDRNGVARRNADTARVQRVREALDKADHWSNAQHLLLAGAIRKEINAIRAALDQEAKPGE